MKLKVDNLGCGTCRVKAHLDLTKHGAISIEYDINKNIVNIDPGPLNRRKVVELLEKNNIIVEGNFGENLILFVDLNEFAIKELSRALSDYVVEFDLKKGTITFDNIEEYDVVEIVELYGYHVKKVIKPL